MEPFVLVGMVGKMISKLCGRIKKKRSPCFCRFRMRVHVCCSVFTLGTLTRRYRATAKAHKRSRTSFCINHLPLGWLLTAVQRSGHIVLCSDCSCRLGRDRKPHVHRNTHLQTHAHTHCIVEGERHLELVLVSVRQHIALGQPREACHDNRRLSRTLLMLPVIFHSIL